MATRLTVMTGISVPILCQPRRPALVGPGGWPAGGPSGRPAGL